MKNTLYGLMFLGIATVASASWTLVDHFENYTAGVDPVPIGTAFGGFDATAFAEAIDGQAVNLIRTSGGGGVGYYSGSSPSIALNASTAATVFFQARFNSFGADALMALSQSGAGAYSDLNILFRAVGGGNVEVRDGGDYLGTDLTLATGITYNFWVVINNSANTWALYSSTGTDAGTIVAQSGDASTLHAFRNVADTTIDTYYFGGNSGADYLIDNMFYSSIAETGNPLGGAAVADLIDDFSGDLSAYTATRILDSDGGAHNPVAWQITGGALELNTSSKVSAVEQHAFIRNGLSLAVDEEIQADFSVSGSQDLGLYVGGATPVTDVRQDYITVYNRGDGNIYSRGFDGMSEYGLEGGGSPVFDKLFIKRTATNTYEAGYYNGTNRTVVATRTALTPNDGAVVGFYADVRAAGTLGNADNLTLLTKFIPDEDSDGLPDAWEQQIIDANTNDAIETIYDVLPVDDFDEDGFTNAQEYELGLDPTGMDAADTDADGDYLPDLWEISNLSNLTYNAYDDPDNDEYNNQAERVGGTDPLLSADHPDFKSPSIAFMRDSIVAGDALLMADGGYYGRAINGISYQDQILYTFDGYQYTAYYDTVGSVQKICLARRTINETDVGVWEIVQTDAQFLNGDESSWDAHNVIAFGICPEDGTLHVAWDHHNHTLRYRKSVAGLCTTNKEAWGSGMLNAEQNWLVAPGQTELDVTYPQFIATPDGGLVFNRRMGISGNGDQYFQRYNPASGAWNAKVQFINRSGTYVGPNPWGSTVTANERCAYINGLDFGPDGKMHVTWTWRESASQYGNRDICYAYSPDMGTSWYNNADVKIADTGLGQKITQSSPGITIAPLDMRQLMINQQAQCVDNDGRVHALMLHRRQDPGYEPAVFSALFSTKCTAYYHYFRDPVTGEWTQRRIPPDDYPVGSRPRIGYDAQGNVYAAYLSYPAGTDVFPGYRQNDDYSPLVIASASKASHYTDWKILQVIDTDFDGEPLIDQARLLSDNILAVYIQEHNTYASGNGIPTPLHVYEFAVNVPEPESSSRISMSFLGDDVIISAFGQSGSNYQTQTSADLTNGWSSVGSPVGGTGRLIALLAVDGLQYEKSFYKVLGSPAP